MKTVFVTLVSGIFISLLTSTSMYNEVSLLDENYQDNQTLSAYDNTITFEEVFGTLEPNTIIEIEDIDVLELEEEVELSFNTKDYLPKDFNPYKGMRNDNELDAEMDLVFEDVFETLESGTIINIESLKGYELEEEVELNFNTKDYLPQDFNPYKRMGNDKELEAEMDIFFKAVFGDIVEHPILDVQDIEVYEVEEEV